MITRLGHHYTSAILLLVHKAQRIISSEYEMRKLKSPPTPRIGGSIFRVLGATKLKHPKRVSFYAMTPNDSDDEEEQADTEHSSCLPNLF